jgi:hypothetical protein
MKEGVGSEVHKTKYFRYGPFFHAIRRFNGYHPGFGDVSKMFP